MSRANSSLAVSTVAVMCLALVPATGLAQQTWERADSLRVSISVDSAALTQSGTVLWMSVEVAADSRQPLWQLVMERRGPIVAVRGPENFRAMAATVDGRPAIFWAGLGVRVRPGETMSGLFVSGEGLPTVSSFWAQGYYPLLKATPATEEDLPLEPSVYDNSYHGTGVGLEPVADPSPSGLLARSGTLLQSACELGWITNASVCHNLERKLVQATASLARGNRQAARGQLHAFVQELTAQRGPERGKHVSENAYWLLRPNVEFLLAQL